MIGKSTLGRLFFAISMVAFGIQQLATGRFVRLVPPLPETSWLTLLAWGTSLVLLAAGVAIAAAGSRAREAAAVVGAMLLLLFLFLHVPQIAADPLVGFRWTNPLKALAMLGGVIILAGALSRDRSSALSGLSRKLAPLGPLFLGLFLIVGGVQHFVYADFVAQLVPSWIPPNQRFWVYLTGVALIAGGAGILLPKTRRLAATLSGIMIFLWVVLLHIPRALTELNMSEASGVFEALALSGVAFILATATSNERGISTPA